MIFVYIKYSSPKMDVHLILCSPETLVSKTAPLPTFENNGTYSLKNQPLCRQVTYL